MEDDTEILADRPFFGLVGYGALCPDSTLARLSGHPAAEPPYLTPLIRHVEQAWCTPLRLLTCEQVREMLGQKMGLEWLGPPILEFLKQQPEAEIMNYPGEMVLLSLRASEEMHAVCGASYARWLLAGNFDWMDRIFGWDADLLDAARTSLDAARARILGRAP